MTGKVPDHRIPFSPEAEEALCGACLTNPSYVPLVREHIRKPEYFFLLRHKWVWEAMLRCHDRGDDIDHIVVGQELSDVGHLDELGGVPYLMRLINNTPTSVHAEVYARLVKRAYLRRALMGAAEEIQQVALNEELPIEKVIELADGRLKEVTMVGLGRTEQTLKEIMADVFDQIEGRGENLLEYYLPTGLPAIDKFSGGIERRCLHILAGQPSMGKTSLTLQLALGMARANLPVAVISNETEPDGLGMRLLAIETGINLQAVKRGAFTPAEESRVVEAIGRLAELPIMIDYLPATTVPEATAKMMRWQREQGIVAVFIDGLWRMEAPEFAGDKTKLQLVYGYITDSLLRAAKNLNIGLVITHQLKQGGIEKREDKRPTIDDLDHGTYVRNNADVVMLLYRDEVYHEDTDFPNQTDIIFAKNRDNPNGVVSLYFDKTCVRFQNAKVQTIDLAELSPKKFQEVDEHWTRKL